LILNSQLQNITDIEEHWKRAKQLYHEHVLAINVLQKDEQLKKELLSWLEECTVVFCKYLISLSHALSQGWNDLYIDDYSLFEDEHMRAYMNRQDVKHALPIEEAPIDKWLHPKAGLDYKKDYNVCNCEDKIMLPNISMINFYQKIIPKLDWSCTYQPNLI
jgi:hypothetical protein